MMTSSEALDPQDYKAVERRLFALTQRLTSRADEVQDLVEKFRRQFGDEGEIPSDVNTT